MMNRVNVQCWGCFSNIKRNLFLQTRLLHTHYDTLGVKKNATQSEIKAAFFKESKKIHPDMNPNDPKSKAKFIKLNEAYSVLSKPSKRREYDLKILEPNIDHKTIHMNRRSSHAHPNVHKTSRYAHPNVHYRTQGGFKDTYARRPPPNADGGYSEFGSNGPYDAFDRRGPKVNEEEEDKYNDTQRLFAFSALLGGLIIGYFLFIASRFRRGIRMKREGQLNDMQNFENQDRLNQEGIWPSSDYRHR